MGYRHTQAGFLGPFLFAIVSAVLAVVAIANDVAIGELTALLVFMVPLGLVLLHFNWLTAIVGDDTLQVAFGWGWPRKRFPVVEIQTIEIVRNRWWYGFGIRLTPTGWMYNVAGLDAVRLDLLSGKSFLIGTDEPEELAAALYEAGAGYLGAGPS